jgi:hypothetical protein
MKRFCLCFLLLSAWVVATIGCRREEAPDWEYTRDMSGTMWPFYQYAVDSVNDTIPHIDTIRFITETNYSWNGGVGTYSMGGNSKYNTCYLHMYGSPFGTLHRYNWWSQQSNTWHVKFESDNGHIYYFW